MEPVTRRATLCLFNPVVNDIIIITNFTKKEKKETADVYISN